MKQICLNIKNKWLDMKKPSKGDWIFLLVILVFCFFTFNHGDLAATSTHGKDLLQVILKGKMLTFYSYTLSTAVYLIPIYILFAIWSIPIAIIFGIGHIPLWGVVSYNAVTFPLLMWYKLLPVLFCIGTAYMLYKIAKEIGMNHDKTKWMIYAFLSFPILIFTQFILGQYDSIGMFFTVSALYFFLQKKYYKFAILMSVAITFKMFSLFIFIPLVLLFEKRFFHIIKYYIIGFAGTIISNLLFLSNSGFSQTKQFTGGMFDRFFYSGISVQTGLVSYFVVIFIGICVFAYLKHIKSNNNMEYYQWSVYIPLTVYSIFFMFILWHPQWFIIIIPFIVLAAFMGKNLKASIILGIVMFTGYVLLVFNTFASNVDEILINNGWMPLVFDKIIPVGGKLSDYFNHFSFLDKNVYVSLLFSALLINLIINYPTKKRIKESSAVLKSNNMNVERGYLIAQPLIVIILFIVPTLYLYFIHY